MTTLFNRSWRVKVHDIEITDLDIAFDIKKSIKRELNKCELRIWNLSETRRKSLEALSTNRKKAKGRIRVEIEAGYVGEKQIIFNPDLSHDVVFVHGRSLIFRGDLRTAYTYREGPDLITKIEGEDGGTTVLAKRVSKSFNAGTSKLAVARYLAEQLGIAPGNLAEFEQELSVQYEYGKSLKGYASKELRRILRSVKLRYSVQDTVLQVLKRRAVIQRSALLLNDETGLLAEEPRCSSDGLVSAKVLLIPDLYPGRLVVADSRRLKGNFRIDRIGYTGESAGEPWWARLELRPI